MDEAIELEIIQLLLERLRAGRKLYGPWLRDRYKQPIKETLEEIIDALHYCAAKLITLEDEQE